MSTNTYHGFSLSDALSGISRAGFRFVELACVKGWTNHFDLEAYSQKDVEDLKMMLSSFGLEVASLSAHSSLATQSGVLYLQKALHFARTIGAKVVNTGTVENEEEKDICLHNLETLTQSAQKEGVKIGLEIHGEFLKSGQKAMGFMEEVRSPFIGVNYDTGNAIFYGSVRPEDDITFCIPWLVQMFQKRTVHQGRDNSTLS
ncbi:MAG: sugar phosphate isomerase/epimerase family protein [Atribacterota bacterium]